MPDPFLGATPKQIITELTAALVPLAPGATVRVGEPHLGVCNVGVDLPCTPRGTSPIVRERQLHRALEAAGLLLAPHALAPHVDGQVRGSVRIAPSPSR
jgi:hypothetical protein